MTIESTDLQNSTNPAITYSECYVQPFFSFYNADNMDIMKTFKDKEFDLAIVDKINMILLLLCQRIFVYLEKVKNI